MSGLEQFKNLIIPEGRVPVAAYQAIYHRITQKTEKISNTRKGAFSLCIDDIENLKRILEQTIQQYKVEAKSDQVIISFSDGEHESYSSLDRMKVVNF